MLKEDVLNWLKSTEGYLSGSYISNRLGVTRAAVWKAINQLRNEGYLIEAAPNRGYRLAGPSDVLNAFEIRSVIQDEKLCRLISQIRFTETTASTNQMARQALETGTASGSLFVAERQTAGRGRRGRTWQSNHGQGLWFSLLLYPDKPSTNLSTLTLFTGLCVAQALRMNFGVEAGIKWPNDVVSSRNTRKICGILTESIVEEQTVAAVIIGVGININTRSFTPDLAGLATSLFLESGSSYRRIDVLAAVLRQFAERYPAYQQDSRWMDEYVRHCLTLGREVLVMPTGGDSFTGRAAGLDKNGELIVENGHGHRITVLSGEVSIQL